MKTIRLTARQINKAIETLKRQKPVINSAFIFPATTKGGINYNLYRGKGRPRESDYIRIPFQETLKGLIKKFY